VSKSRENWKTQIKEIATKKLGFKVGEIELEKLAFNYFNERVLLNTILNILKDNCPHPLLKLRLQPFQGPGFMFWED